VRSIKRQGEPWIQPPVLPVAITLTSTTTPTAISIVTTIHHTIIQWMDHIASQAMHQMLVMDHTIHTITCLTTTMPQDTQQAPAPAHTKFHHTRQPTRTHIPHMITQFTATPTITPTTRIHITPTITAVQYTQVVVHLMCQPIHNHIRMLVTQLGHIIPIATILHPTLFRTTPPHKLSQQVVTTCHPIITVDPVHTTTHHTTLLCMALTLNTNLAIMTTTTVPLCTAITMFHTTTIQMESLM